jgi:ribosomal protein S18 acetylase RimI-like enzyme
MSTAAHGGPSDGRRPAALELGIAVRPAVAADAAAIARVLTESLDDKFRPAFGDRAARAMTAVVQRDLEYQRMSYWVAERDRSVVGAVHLATEQRPEGGFVAGVASELGWLAAVRAAAVFSLLAHSALAPDEAYVEELAVDASARRLGAARALLAACEEQARRRGKARLTLWVTANNDPAIALYSRLGFRVRRRRRTLLLGRLLFRAPAALFMEKPLGEA